MTEKFRMSRSTFWTLWIIGVVGLGVLLGVFQWALGGSQAQNGVGPHALLYTQIFAGAFWVSAWALVAWASYRQEKRDFEWKAGAQARRETAIKAQMARMGELHKLIDAYGMDVAVAAYLLDEDPGEVQRVCG
jgi:hypothetical protein